MKKFILTMVMMLTIVASANAMSYSQASRQALFLSDKMAYELGLTSDQYNAVYEVNLDYYMALANRNDIFGNYWSIRNSELQYILNSYQYSQFLADNYFYRPVYWVNNTWTFGIYSRYASRNLFYRTRPTVFTSYRGGNTPSHFANRSISKPRVITNPRGQDWHLGTPNKTTKPANISGNRRPTTAPNRPQSHFNTNTPNRKPTTVSTRPTKPAVRPAQPAARPNQPASHFGGRR